jgi:hypothetical protein
MSARDLLQIAMVAGRIGFSGKRRVLMAVFVLAGVIGAGGAGAATIVVNDSSDTLHASGCAAFGTGSCTLRDAIIFGNANAGPDVVHFAIPGSGVHTITLVSDLPAVTGDLTIDGYTQPGSSPNTNGAGLGDNAVLLVEVNGNGKGCFTLVGGGATLRGLVINRCGGYAVHALSGSIIEGNFIGTDPTGKLALPDSAGGIFIDNAPAILGGADPDSRNLISGNGGAGVAFDLTLIADAPLIQGNFIGTDVTGTAALPNGGSGVSGGGPSPIEISDNVISGNGGRGIELGEGFTNLGGKGVNIHGNLIGTDLSGTLPIGNRLTGIWARPAIDANVRISGNTIAFNGAGDPFGGGVVYFEGTDAYHDDPVILGNSIFENTSDGSVPNEGLGISLYTLGPDSILECNNSSEGGQPSQNFPVLTSALAGGSSIRIEGTFESGGKKTYTLEFFANPSCDPSGYGEGKLFLGSIQVTTEDFPSCDVTFDVTFPVAVAAGQFVTATATDASTSEFSACIPVESAANPAVVVNDVSDILHAPGCATLGTGTCTLRDAITFANGHAGADVIHFAIPGSGLHTITLDSDLPASTDELAIDGYTQDGSSPNTNGAGLNAVLTVEINGNAHGCLVLGGDANIVRGLVINRCSGSGILVSGGEEAVSPSLIAGNFVGVDAAGAKALPNEKGVLLVSDSGLPPVVIGGTSPAARNLISGNRAEGVAMPFSPFFGSSLILQGNLIGTDATGTLAIPNGGDGIKLISPAASLEGNVISGNLGSGVTAHTANVHDLTLRDNIIGADVTGTSPLGNRSRGIFIIDDDNSSGYRMLISGNVVAFNGAGDGGGGVVYQFGHFAENSPAIRGNSIFDNSGRGIDLGGLPNDHCNFNPEGHRPPNFPVLNSAQADRQSIRIRGTLDSYELRTYTIEFFANPECDPSGYGEGKTFLGSTQVTTADIDFCNATFDVTFPLAVAPGQFVTATATAPAGRDPDATSEFSACVEVEWAAAPEVVNQQVTVLSMTHERNRTPVPGGPAGTMTIRATFQNWSVAPIGAPFFQVAELTGGNLLLNADGGPAGVGGRLKADVGPDELLSPGESFTTEFVIGLQNGSRFRFLVDVWGQPPP